MKENFAKLGLTAAKRAAKKVVSEARRDGRLIPTWKNGEVVYLAPDQIDLELDDIAKVKSHGTS